MKRKMKIFAKVILDCITGLSVIAFFIFMCMLDSESNVPADACFISGIVLLLCVVLQRKCGFRW